MYKNWIKRRWEKDTRYYEAHLQQDLWGDWIVTKVWGKKGSRLGRMVDVQVKTHKCGLKQLNSIQKKRIKRGYKKCS